MFREKKHKKQLGIYFFEPNNRQTIKFSYFRKIFFLLNSCFSAKVFAKTETYGENFRYM
jgi:hypothetical protein